MNVSGKLICLALTQCLQTPAVPSPISEHRMVFFVARLCLSQPHGFMPMPLIEKKGLKRNAADVGFSSVFGYSAFSLQKAHFIISGIHASMMM